MFVKEKVWKFKNQLESVAALIGVVRSGSMLGVRSSGPRVCPGHSLKIGEQSQDANPLQLPASIRFVQLVVTTSANR